MRDFAEYKPQLEEVTAVKNNFFRSIKINKKAWIIALIIFTLCVLYSLYLPYSKESNAIGMVTNNNARIEYVRADLDDKIRQYETMLKDLKFDNEKIVKILTPVKASLLNLSAFNIEEIRTNYDKLVIEDKARSEEDKQGEYRLNLDRFVVMQNAYTVAKKRSAFLLQQAHEISKLLDENLTYLAETKKIIADSEEDEQKELYAYVHKNATDFNNRVFRNILNTEYQADKNAYTNIFYDTQGIYSRVKKTNKNNPF